MDIKNVPFFTTNWDEIQATEHSGEIGSAFWKVLQLGDIRVRKIEYTAGYLADHWCERGHILLVLEGELLTELKDGRKFVLPAGTSYQVASQAEAHRSSSKIGAKLFIVD